MLSFCIERISFENRLFINKYTSVLSILQRRITDQMSNMQNPENLGKPAGDGGQNFESKEEKKKDESLFECNICLDTAHEAVVSMCGHLFCWPCLHQWLQTRPNSQLCPVCKAAISKEKVIPLYGRGSTKQEDPRDKVPPRPAGQRTEPEPTSSFSGFGFGDNSFQMSFGIGAFPFGFFTSSFNIGDRRQPVGFHAQDIEENLLSKLFLWMAMLFLFWLILA